MNSHLPAETQEAISLASESYLPFLLYNTSLLCSTLLPAATTASLLYFTCSLGWPEKHDISMLYEEVGLRDVKKTRVGLAFLQVLQTKTLLKTSVFPNSGR